MVRDPSHTGATEVERNADWVPANLFEFLRAVVPAKGLKDRQKLLALAIAETGTGGSGRECTIDAELLGTWFGVAPRTIWRWVGDLREQGWLNETQKPARGVNGRRGRRARYRLQMPGSFDISPGSPVTRSAPDRLTSGGGTSDTGPLAHGDVLPSVGSSTPLPPALSSAVERFGEEQVEQAFETAADRCGDRAVALLLVERAAADPRTRSLAARLATCYFYQLLPEARVAASRQRKRGLELDERRRVIYGNPAAYEAFTVALEARAGDEFLALGDVLRDLGLRHGPTGSIVG